MKLLENYIEFFTKPFPARVHAVFRICFGTVFFLTLLLYGPYLSYWYTDTGLWTSAMAKAQAGPDRWSLLFYIGDPPLVYTLYAVLLASALSFAFGIFPRICAACMYVGFLSVIKRYDPVNYGGTIILLRICFVCIFSEFSSNYTPKWYQKKFPSVSEIKAWPIRLIQLQISIIYFFSGLHKLRSDSWVVAGEAMGMILHQDAQVHTSLPFIYFNSLFSAWIGYAVILSELTCPILIWMKETRVLALSLLAGMHVAILMTLNVTYFSQIMLSALTLFLLPADLRYIGSLIPRRKQIVKN